MGGISTAGEKGNVLSKGRKHKKIVDLEPDYGNVGSPLKTLLRDEEMQNLRETNKNKQVRVCVCIKLLWL